MNTRILVIEDDIGIRDMLTFALEHEQYQVIAAGTPDEARSHIEHMPPDLILLDWMLPHESGLQFLHRLKRDKDRGHIPVIMLTAKTLEEDKIAGLDAGADDYLPKPFSPKELIARIKAVLRRTTPKVNLARIEHGALIIDTNEHRLWANEKRINLGPTEFKLLHFFMSRPNRVFTRQQLLDYVWGNDIYVEDRTVDVHIRRLRRELEPHDLAHLIETVRGTGYRFSTDEAISSK